MSYQRLPFRFSRSVLPSVGLLGAVALVIGCASLLGIEDAECDPSYDPECSQPGAGGSSFGAVQMTPGLQPANGGGGGSGGASNPAAAGAGGSSAVTTVGTGGLGGGTGVAGSSAMGAMAGSAGSASMGVDPVVQRATPLCLDYCDTVMASCTGMNQQYASQTACLLVCELLPPGTPGSTSGNNVTCRLSRADLAATTGEGANYCYTAGPGGGDVCGSDCDGYCTLMRAKCSEFATIEECMTECDFIPDLSLPPTPQFYNTTMQSGDSLQCRLFHVTASTLDPVGHCPHAAGNTPCN